MFVFVTVMHTKLSQSTVQWQEYPEYGLGFPLLQDPSINQLVLDKETVAPFVTKSPNKQDSDRVCSNLNKKAFKNDVPTASVVKLQQLWDQVASEKAFEFYWSDDLWNYGLARKDKNAVQAIEAYNQRHLKESRSKLRLSNKTIKRMQHMKPINKPSTWLAGDTALFLTPLVDAQRHVFWLAQICGFDDFYNPKNVIVYWLESSHDYGRYHHCKVGRGPNSYWRDTAKIETVIAVFTLNTNKTIPEPVANWIKYNVLGHNPERCVVNEERTGRIRPPEDVSTVAASRVNISIILDENEDNGKTDDEPSDDESSIPPIDDSESVVQDERDESEQVVTSVIETRTHSGLLSLGRLHPSPNTSSSSSSISSNSSVNSQQSNTKRQQAKRQQAKGSHISNDATKSKRRNVYEKDEGWRIAAFKK